MIFTNAYASPRGEVATLSETPQQVSTIGRKAIFEMRKRTASIFAVLVTAVLLPGVGETDPAAAGAVQCAGKVANGVGTSKKDVIIGSSGPDIIAAGRGNDTVISKGGDDVICGGGGADVMDGQEGLDTIYGGNGTDQCFGTPEEHRSRHFSCEAHLPTQGGNGSPGRGSQLVAPRAQSSPATNAASNSTSTRYSNSASTRPPVCSRTSSGAGYIDHDLAVSSAPGYGAVASRATAWLYINDGWNLSFSTDWQYWNVPTDGRLYNISPPRQSLGNGNWAVVYDVWWSADGGQTYTLHAAVQPAQYLIGFLGLNPLSFCSLADNTNVIIVT